MTKDQPLRVVFRRFWPFTAGVRARVVAVAVVFALIPLVEAVEIWLFSELVDRVLVPRSFDPLPGLAVLFVGLNLMAGAIGFAGEWLATATGERFRLRLRGALFGHLLRLSPLQLQRHPLGDVLSRLGGDVASIEQIVVSGPSTALEHAVKVLVFTGMLVWIDPLLAFVSLLAAPLFWGAARKVSDAVRRTARVKRLHTGRLQSLAEEVLGALPQIQAASAERFEEDRFRREGEAVLRAEMRATRIAGIFRPMVDLLELIGALVVLATGVWALTEGRLTLGALLAFLTYLTQLYSPVRHLGDLMLTGHRAAAGAELVAEILDEPPLVADVAVADEDVPPVGGMVSLNDVSYSYPEARQPALVDVSLHMWPGTVTAIVGDSGAGKSTLVALLLRLIDPDKGVVRIGNEDLRHLPLRQVRSSIGVLFQETYLFDGTVADNVAYGGKGDARTVASALDQADATEFVERLVGAADHQIGPKGRSLSGGQRRRLALARLLHADPPVLVLDEFSAGLDRASAARILDVVRAPHRTVLLITHDLEVAAAADRVVSIHRGRIVSADSPILVGSG